MLKCTLRLLICLSLALMTLPVKSLAGSFTVTKIEDTKDGKCDADCSLREAIIATNENAGADDVTVPTGTYLLTLVGAGEDESNSGDLDIDGELTVVGAGVDLTVIDGNHSDRVIDVSIRGNVQIQGLSIRGGATVNTGENGGGIRNKAITAVRGSAGACGLRTGECR